MSVFYLWKTTETLSMSFFSNRRQPEHESQQPQRVDKPALPSSSSSEQPQVMGFESVIGANCTIEGQLHSSGNVRIDGEFTGSLEIDGNVLIGETAAIKADIQVRNISIAGKVRGNINGQRIQVLRTGRVTGDINATALATEEGAFIDGRITMTHSEPEIEEGEVIADEDTSASAAEVVAEPEFIQDPASLDD
jgi:cytoskeletal protein CcmA (bactofilin family)